mgnify:CR=1 FL=1
MKKNKTKILIFSSILIIVGFFYLINLIIGKDGFGSLKSLLSMEQKKIIMKYIFPYKVISQQEAKLSEQQKIITEQEEEFILFLAEMELMIKKINSDIQTTKSIFKLSNNKNLEKYKLDKGFYYGIANLYPGSGYIDFYDNNLFILSSRGILAYSEDIDNISIFNQIQNNINDFIDFDDFVNDSMNWFSLKDILIFKNKVFISLTEEIKKDCWNTSIIYGDINYEKINFKKLFSPEKCLSEKNIDKEFVPTQSGGRIIPYDDNHILFSIGEYRNRFLAQDKESVNGKIIKININNSEYQIVSMGHRNPQGLFFDKENNFILETEHGPMGGDEINLIEVKNINEDKIQNYGWPKVSAGEHYRGRIKANETKYEKYPLYKSHSEYGFIEPLKSFVPSIAISEIVKIGQNRYVVSSMKDKSLYFFNLDKQKKMIDLERVEVNERIRDLKFKENALYLFMEDTASIGVINLN